MEVKANGNRGRSVAGDLVTFPDLEGVRLLCRGDCWEVQAGETRQGRREWSAVATYDTMARATAAAYRLAGNTLVGSALGVFEV